MSKLITAEGNTFRKAPLYVVIEFGNILRMSGWDRLDVTWQQVMEVAFESYFENSIPIGAVVANDQGEIVSVGRNRFTQDRIAHAETESLKTIPGDLDRRTASIYCSMEPCPMCTGAIRIMQLKSVYMAARDPVAGSTDSFRSTKFMRHFECQVFRPKDDLLEFVNVAMNLEHRTRNGHKRWRDDWFAYLPKAVEAGEELAALRKFETWVNDKLTPEEIYNEFASYRV